MEIGSVQVSLAPSELASNGQATFFQLPEELQCYIFSLLGLREVGIVPCVCKEWKRLAEDKGVRRSLARQHLGISKLSEGGRTLPLCPSSVQWCRAQGTDGKEVPPILIQGCWASANSSGELVFRPKDGKGLKVICMDTGGDVAFLPDSENEWSPKAWFRTSSGNECLLVVAGNRYPDREPFVWDPKTGQLERVARLPRRCLAQRVLPWKGETCLLARRCGSDRYFCGPLRGNSKIKNFPKEVDAVSPKATLLASIKESNVSGKGFVARLWDTKRGNSQCEIKGGLTGFQLSLSSFALVGEGRDAWLVASEFYDQQKGRRLCAYPLDSGRSVQVLAKTRKGMFNRLAVTTRGGASYVHVLGFSLDREGDRTVELRQWCFADGCRRALQTGSPSTNGIDIAQANPLLIALVPSSPGVNRVFVRVPSDQKGACALLPFEPVLGARRAICKPELPDLGERSRGAARDPL